jgi:hypothetical protein
MRSRIGSTPPAANLCISAAHRDPGNVYALHPVVESAV